MSEISSNRDGCCRHWPADAGTTTSTSRCEPSRDVWQRRKSTRWASTTRAPRAAGASP